ncbi:MAG: peptidase inhibitor family I36 protein [Aeromicrobium sp.]
MKLSTTSARVLAATALLATVAVLHPSAAEATPQVPATSSDCPSGNFCVWSRTNFRGEMQKIAATNSYRTINLTTTASYYNNRTKRTWLHEEADGSGASVCVGPGASKSSTSGWQSAANGAYLATVTSC